MRAPPQPKPTAQQQEAPRTGGSAGQPVAQRAASATQAAPGIASPRESIAGYARSHASGVARSGAVPNRTGLPDQLKTGLESLSGISMDDVRVHRNSGRPAQLQALAHTQGSDIHLGPGQERHLAHEAWHVVQQKQGRAQPTMHLGGTAINNDAGLEREADSMGARAARSGQAAAMAPPIQRMARAPRKVVQREIDPDWSQIASVKQSKSTQVGVFFVTGKDGTEYVVKFEQESAAEGFASEFIRTMSGSARLAPEATTVMNGGAKANQLKASLNALFDAGKLDDAGKNLRTRLATFDGPDILVMETARGKSMHPDDRPDVLAFTDPSFVKSLGELAAYDVALANYDRVLMGLNLGNILHDSSTGRTQGIDQMARTEEIGMSGRDLVDSILRAVMDDAGPSKWAKKIAGLIEALYGVEVSAHDLDTGFAAGMLTIRGNLTKLVPLMQSRVGVMAETASGATVGRTFAYMQALERIKPALTDLVVRREIDIAGRSKASKPVLARAAQMASSSQQKGSAKKDCFLTTACIVSRGLADDCFELRTLRSFRDGYMRALPDGPAMIEEYYRIAPVIVEAIDASGECSDIYDDLYERLVLHSVELIGEGRLHDAMEHYRAVVLALKDDYVPAMA